MKAWSFLVGIMTLGFLAATYWRLPPARQTNLTQQEKQGFVILGSIGILLILPVLCVREKARPKRQQVGKNMLDTVLLKWTPNDFFKVHDLVAGGVCIMGRTGSGKSSSSGFQIGEAIVDLRQSGGLILGSKPQDKQFWQNIFSAAGRANDLLVFEPGSRWRFNPIVFEMQAGADSREITRLLMTVGETLKRGATARGGSNESFWEGQKERTLYSAVEVTRKAGKLSVPDLVAFLADAATCEAQLADKNWRKGIHCRYLKWAMESPKNQIEEHDNEQALGLFLGEWPKMDPKVRSSITADIMGTLAILNSGEIRVLLSTETNISPAVMEQGKWILVNMPVHERGAGGLAVNAAWKYAVQRFILRRPGQPGTNPIIIWADEFQNSSNSFDASFLAECRSHFGGMIVLTQSVHSFHSSMAQGGGGDHETKALLANFSLKVFHSLGDSESAMFAASLVGKSLQQRSSFSRQPAKDLWEEMYGNQGVGFSSTEHMEEILQPNVFMHGLRTGGAANDYLADAIIIKSGERFSNGSNWLKVAFSQR